MIFKLQEVVLLCLEIQQPEDWSCLPVWRFNNPRIGVVCHSLGGMWYVQLDCPEDANTELNPSHEDGKALLLLLSLKEQDILEALQTKICTATIQLCQFQGNEWSLILFREHLEIFIPMTHK